jgi:hypothetical protein
MNANAQQHRALLQHIAHRAMRERGLLPDFSAEALAELGKLQAPAIAKHDQAVRDLTSLLRASIDAVNRIENTPPVKYNLWYNASTFNRI